MAAHVLVGGRLVAVALIGVVSLTGVAPSVVSATARSALDLHRSAQPDADIGPVLFEPPVNAIVRDPFRLESGRYGAGNRGLEYATQEGDIVRSIGDGVVDFAGTVAGSRYVTVRHPDGLRSSYSHLGIVSVTAGQSVRIGHPVGRAGAVSFHLGVREGDRYIDPQPLFGGALGPLVPRLIPDGSFGR